LEVSGAVAQDEEDDASLWAQTVDPTKYADSFGAQVGEMDNFGLCNGHDA
jgi:hypothetical protein